MFRTLLVLLVGLFGAMGSGTLNAQQWSEFAYISGTLGVSDSRICIGEASRGEIGCPAFAPTISSTGRVHATAGLTVNSVSLTTAGTTWGYLGSTASYLPNLQTNNISLSTINGVSVTNLGGASPTNVPAFRAFLSGNQSIATSTFTKLNLTSEGFDTYNNYNAATSRFTPTVAGYYLITLSVGCDNVTSGQACMATIFKNGASIKQAFGRSTNSIITSVAVDLIYMNGSTDYLEGYAYSEATTASINGSSNYTSFAATLVASGNGLISGSSVTDLGALTDVTLSSPATGQILTYNGTSWVNTTPSATTVISGTTTMVSGWPDAIMCNFTTPNWGVRIIPLSYAPWNGDGRYFYRITEGASPSTYYFGLIFNSDKTFHANDYNTSSGAQTSTSDCSNKSISQLYAEGKAFNFIGNSGAGGGALGDRLTSGTLAVTANSATSIISLTTNGTTWGYMGANASYLPNMATNALQVISATTPITCDSTRAGTLRYNSPTTALELCTGTGWQVMGVGIPAGTISAFASTTCPTGWSEYTPARGRFLRGIDNGAGNDPAGTRAPGNIQADLIGSHNHPFTDGADWRVNGGTGSSFGFSSSTADSYVGTTNRAGVVGYSGGAETRPKNVAVTFCQFNGTSNGWNNPLSGGNTTPGGSTGQIQYNTSGSFDANAGLTWDNAGQRLTATNISTGQVSATVVKLAEDPANPCDTAALGTFKTANGKFFICRQ